MTGEVCRRCPNFEITAEGIWLCHAGLGLFANVIMTIEVEGKRLKVGDECGAQLRAYHIPAGTSAHILFRRHRLSTAAVRPVKCWAESRLWCAFALTVKSCGNSRPEKLIMWESFS